MKKLIKYTFISLLAIMSSGCADYLDVVPDKTQEISLLFDRKESAYRALATCYHYIPVYDNTYGMIGASDEMIMNLDRVTPGKQVVLGQLNADYPVLGYWNDAVDNWKALSPADKSFFVPIRICNEFLENIQRVPDMTQSEISRWSAEVKFLKAYYHFMLFSQYGPIPLIKENIPIDAEGEAAMPKRQPVDDVVNYIVSLLDESIEALPTKVTSATELGRIDQVIAKGLKAKVLLYAASPLFNNNPMYAGFTDKDGVKLFPSGDTQAEHQKWVNAATALKEAIDAAEGTGSKLYKYTDSYPEYDTEYIKSDPDRLPYMYNYQYMMVDKWNEELIWGLSRISNKGAYGSQDWHYIQRSVNFKHKDESSTGDAWQWFSPSMNAAEFFYTKNGLPMDEDPDFDYDNRYELTTITDTDADVAIPGEQTVKIHMNREPRFYASIGFDRSRVRGYGQIYDLKFRFKESNGRPKENDIDFSLGYFLRKVVHPDSKGTNSSYVLYAWPIIRLGELYLSYAEALNEAYGTEKQSDILFYLNEIRRRSGVPDIEEAWAKAKKHPDYYKTQEGMREIIHQERTIELSFEGYRNDDVRRWLKGDIFNSVIRTWNANSSTAEGFYQIQELKNMLHVFTQRNYLWPIATKELVNNTNLVQNPGY